MTLKGPFQVKVSPEAPYETVDGVSLSRVRVDKTFTGPLSATSVVNMLAVGGPDRGSGAYVATERIEGTLEGKRGTFVVMHQGVMGGGQQSLTIAIVPGSGTGELAGIAGHMTIEIQPGGAHFYELHVTLPAASGNEP